MRIGSQQVAILFHWGDVAAKIGRLPSVEWKSRATETGPNWRMVCAMVFKSKPWFGGTGVAPDVMRDPPLVSEIDLVA